MIRKIAIALACAMSLTACAGGPVPSTPASTQVALRAEQTLYVAEAAYNGALLGTQAAVAAGALKGEDASRVLAIVDRADGYRKGAELAFKVGNTADAVTNAMLVLQAVADVQASISAK